MKRIIGIVLAGAFGIAANAMVITTINSVADLRDLATSVNSGEDYTNVTVTLCGDLNLSSAGDWTPIGTTAHPFIGTFDGQGKTLTNLNADGSADLTAGLFGVVGAGGVVKDVHIGSGTIAIKTNSDTYISFLGGIAGRNYGKIVGCSNAASVTGYSYKLARIGGIVGTNESGGSIENCYNLGTVYTSLSNVFIGGVVGDNSGAVKNCWMSCTVTSSITTNKSYPLYGNNSGTVTGCFYASGTSNDAISPAAIVLANATDNSTTISGNTGSGKNVLLDSRTLLGNGDWNTLCLPFPIPASGNGRSPIAGAVVKELTSAAINGNSLNVGFTEVTAIEAGKPYLVKWTTETNISNPMFLNVTISATTPSATSLINGDVQFVGTFSPTLLTNNGKQLFISSGNQIHYPKSNSYTIKSCRAYFNVNWAIAANARLEMVVIDDETTGIKTIYDDRDQMSDVYYTLDGRLVEKTNPQEQSSKLPKGLYIIRSANGQGVKKVLINK
jgi:hypothetical protein